MARRAEPTEADRRFMGRAIELAGAGWGRVHPNPLVGAVVVRDGVVVGEGAHREFGGPHAEVEALEAAGSRAAGATLYVTLEPCAHHGKTPPCSTAILDHDLARVVYAVADPNPEATGGAKALADRGLEVLGGVEEARARRANALFLVPMERGRPYVALKFGLTLDARIARAAGQRTPVTGPEARAAVHRLRSGFDAVMIGGRTAQIDDPALTIRDAPRPRVPPRRVVLDPSAALPLDGTLVRSARETPVVLVASADAPAARVDALRTEGVDVVRVDSAPGGVDLRAALDALWGRGVRTVFCEGGGRLGSALLTADLVDRLYLFYAPLVYGDAGVPAFPGAPFFRGTRGETRPLGADTLVTIDRSE